MKNPFSFRPGKILLNPGDIGPCPIDHNSTLDSLEALIGLFEKAKTAGIPADCMDAIGRAFNETLTALGMRFIIHSDKPFTDEL